jgi:hypothetical protein
MAQSVAAFALLLASLLKAHCAFNHAAVP